jgi:hypothetical protein
MQDVSNISWAYATPTGGASNVGGLGWPRTEDCNLLLAAVPPGAPTHINTAAQDQLYGGCGPSQVAARAGLRPAAWERPHPPPEPALWLLQADGGSSSSSRDGSHGGASAAAAGAPSPPPPPQQRRPRASGGSPPLAAAAAAAAAPSYAIRVAGAPDVLVRAPPRVRALYMALAATAKRLLRRHGHSTGQIAPQAGASASAAPAPTTPPVPILPSAPAALRLGPGPLPCPAAAHARAVPPAAWQAPAGALALRRPPPTLGTNGAAPAHEASLPTPSPARDQQPLPPCRPWP